MHVQHLRFVMFGLLVLQYVVQKGTIMPRSCFIIWSQQRASPSFQMKHLDVAWSYVLVKGRQSVCASLTAPSGGSSILAWHQSKITGGQAQDAFKGPKLRQQQLTQQRKDYEVAKHRSLLEAMGKYDSWKSVTKVNKEICVQLLCHCVTFLSTGPRHQGLNKLGKSMVLRCNFASTLRECHAANSLVLGSLVHVQQPLCKHSRCCHQRLKPELAPLLLLSRATFQPVQLLLHVHQCCRLSCSLHQACTRGMVTRCSCASTPVFLLCGK